MLHLALYEPEIPPNTGNIIRLCANSNTQLHLIEPLGFDLETKKLRRAGLDYHEFADIKLHKNFDDFLQSIPEKRIFALSTKGTKRYCDISYKDSDCILFGPETRGLPENIREHERVTDLLTIPMAPQSRSLNLSNSAAIVCYEAWKQLNFPL